MTSTRCKLHSQAKLSSPANRRGFTLLELSLVLVVLVVMTSLAAPLFQGTLDRERLRKAAESIAADWTRTRAMAIQSGEVQLWACQLDTGSFAAGSADPSMNSSNGAIEGSAAQPTTAEDLLSTAQLSGQLPQGIVIGSAKISELDTIADMSQSTLVSESGTATMFFYPDGTSSIAQLTVGMEDDAKPMTMSVMINGLAGTVRVLQGSTSSGASR